MLTEPTKTTGRPLAVQHLEEDSTDAEKEKRTLEAFQQLALVECDPWHTHAPTHPRRGGMTMECGVAGCAGRPPQ